MPDTTYLDWPFFDDSHRELARELAAWTRSEIRSGIENDDVDEECRSLVRRLGADGWLRYVVPARYGGMRQQLDVRSLCIAREVLAHQCALADFAFAMQGLGAGAISIFGSDEQRERYLPRVARGEAIAAFALSESDAGSDVTAMRCSAKKEGSGYVIDGQKTWISNAGIADHYVVFCRMAEGDRRFGAFVVDADNSGLRVTDRIDVISPHPLGTLAFESCEVPSEALIGKAGKGLSVALGTLDLFRPTVGAAALGFARRALDEAMSWVTERCAFGQPLAQFQLTQEKLARMAVAIDASALLVYRAAWTRDAGATRITREAAMAKLFATESAQQVIDDALQLLGGRGLVSGTPVERLYRDIRALRIYEGTSEIQKLVIAGQMLGAMLTGGESSTKNTGVGAPPR